MDTTAFYLHSAAAALLGTVIGLERQWRMHTFGLRTNALVAFGACLFVSIAHMLNGTTSPAHLAGQVATGVGFLGGGVIMREGLNVKGMNTAATLWCSAAVGGLCGVGFMREASAATLGVLVLHLALRPISDWLDRRHKLAKEVETMYRLKVSCRTGQEGVVRAVLLKFFHDHPTMTIQGIAMQEGGVPERATVVADVYSQSRDDRTMEELMALLNDEPSVVSVSWEKNLST